MLVLFGSSVYQKEITEFDFEPAACPSCMKKLKIIEVTRWFTFFFIRLIKTDDLGFYYWCQLCQKEYSNTELQNI